MHVNSFSHPLTILSSPTHTTQASDPLLASLPLRLSPPLASVSESTTTTAEVNSAFQIVASVLGSDVETAIAYLPEQASEMPAWITIQTWA